jgi:hypothetical protein
MSNLSKLTNLHIKPALRILISFNKPLLGRWSINNQKYIDLIANYANKDQYDECITYQKERVSNKDNKDK